MHTYNVRSAPTSIFSLLAAGAALAASPGPELLFSNAQNAAAITEADRAAIYTQLNLKVGADGKSLVFVDGEQCPPLLIGTGESMITVEDLNGDTKPEVFASLGSTCMFGHAGIGVSVFIKDGAGLWKNHNLGAGFYSVEKTRNKGYADIMVGGPGFCHPVLRWNGTTYVFHHKVAEQPGGCDGQ